MSLPEAPPFVLPVASVLYGHREDLAAASECLCAEFGEAVLQSGEFAFDMTNYYQQEMGTGILRVWLCFNPLADPSELSVWKKKSIRIEDKFGGEGKRRVNIDPGYLDHSKLVLASCKAAPDKIYVGSGVYAHMCLRYRSGEFHAPGHSFADFQDGRFNCFFGEARIIYRDLLRKARH